MMMPGWYRIIQRTMFAIVALILGLAIFVYAREEDKPKEKLISETALRGCEQAGADVESQLRRCEWAFELCVQTNEVLKQKIKEKTNGSDD